MIVYYKRSDETAKWAQYQKIGHKEFRYSLDMTELDSYCCKTFQECLPSYFILQGYHDESFEQSPNFDRVSLGFDRISLGIREYWPSRSMWGIRELKFCPFCGKAITFELRTKTKVLATPRTYVSDEYTEAVES